MSSRLFHKNVFWLTILMIVGIVVPSAFAQGGKRVLYINSYNMSFPASVDQYRGLQSVLDTTGMMVYAEFMNSKRFPGADNIESFYKRLEFLVKKSLPYDAIIVSDDAAFRFVIENQNKLFYHIPIFFFGVNDIQFGLAQNSNPWVVGLLEKASSKEH
jgi:DNA-binding LacI/PurR family transcriptional regulator